MLFQGRSRARHPVRNWRLAATVAALLAAAGGYVAIARTDPPAPASGSVALADLPREAVATHQSILKGGPFPYEKDGSVFANRERLLPQARRGHYREYTVPTPGAPDRGARRIVCGGEVSNRPEVCFYTRDHYASFQRIQP